MTPRLMNSFLLSVLFAVLYCGKMYNVHNVKLLIVKCRPQGQDYTHTRVQLSLLSKSIGDFFIVPN